MIGFDADDTLWHSEDGFRANEERFVELITPYAPEGVDVKAALTATERKNLAHVRLRREVVRAVDGRGRGHDQRRAGSVDRRRRDGRDGQDAVGGAGAVARPRARGARRGRRDDAG